MAGSLNDKFTDTFNSANPNVARVTGTRSALGTTLTCDNLAGWPTTSSKVHFSTYQINTNGAVVAGTQIDWEGIVSGNSIGSLTRMAGAADAGSSIGDVVEMNATGSWGHDLFTGLTAEHSTQGVHALTSNSTLTSSKVVTSLNDTNGNELFKVTPTGSAVNEFTVANAATGAGPTLSATGGDTNIDINITPKGTGKIKGFVNNLNNPYKFNVTRVAGQNVGTANTKVVFDTENFDSNNNFATGTYTAPLAGYYQFNANILTTSAGSGTNIAVYLYKNGSQLLTLSSIPAASGTTPGGGGAAFLLLAANDTIEIYVGTAAAAKALDVTLAGNNTFSGYLVSST